MSLKRVTRFFTVALAGCMLFTGCGKINTSAKLITVQNGDKTETITLGYGNFVARYNQALYDVYYGSYMGEDMWTTDMMGTGATMEADTKESVIEELENWYVEKQNAADYNVSLSDEDTMAIEEAAKKFMSDNSEAAIEQIGATEEYVKQLLTDRTYAVRMEEAIRKEAEGKVEVTDAEAKQATISYLQFDKADAAASTADAVVDAVNDIENGEEPSNKSEEALADAKKAAAAADFDAADTAVDVDADTFSYNPDDKAEDVDGMPAEVIEAAKSLSEGQMSDVIETDSAYYVIRLDSKLDKVATASRKQELQEEKVTKYYEDILKGYKDKLTFTVDEKNWEKVKFEERFTNGASEASDENDVTEEVLNGEEVDLNE
ncbi:MAG: peptidyl-prolyl cis-trans isomerase [Lachnospiraceae bacterium]|nr:peptidyl-prolyl cis-trans isomerase [Lachnospiraceae bacterium]